MKYPATADSARISEVFSSLQGEGPYQGQPHMFVRFEECHIHCTYCDELGKVGRAYSPQSLLERLGALELHAGPHAYVSLTGGEPLLYLPFLMRVMPEIKKRNWRIYLETDGILWQALERVIGWCDVIAADLKPSSVTKEEDFSSEHRRFLQIARNQNLFVKMVISRDLDIKEFWHLVRVMKETAPDAPLVLQAVTPIAHSVPPTADNETALMELLTELREQALGQLKDVRIIGRLHQYLNLP
ncbi:MAG: hypothetical protein A2Z83_09000 [Omnitrophica bacterium GWA2_52_8]|nr:MAG: hypothetical protein A2Z83_09000 [Omnitrophica bacterium GWA2_52_8]